MSENTSTSEQLTKPQSLLGTLERRLKNYHAGEYGKQQFTLTVELKLIKQIKEALANEPRKAKASEVRVDALVSDNRRWKSVDEALPRTNGAVLINKRRREDDIVEEVYFEDGKFYYDRDNGLLETIEGYGFKITHWMYLPKPPE